jgi:hypothetical protein
MRILSAIAVSVCLLASSDGPNVQRSGKDPDYAQRRSTLSAGSGRPLYRRRANRLTLSIHRAFARLRFARHV